MVAGILYYFILFYYIILLYYKLLTTFKGLTFHLPTILLVSGPSLRLTT